MFVLKSKHKKEIDELKSNHKKEIYNLLRLLRNAEKDRDDLKDNFLRSSNDISNKLRDRMEREQELNDVIEGMRQASYNDAETIKQLNSWLATYKGQLKNQYDKGYGDGYDTGILEGYCSDDNKTGYLENLYTRLSKINKFNKIQAELRAELLRIGFTGPYEIERAQKHVHNLIRFTDARYRYTSKERSFKK